MFKTILCFIILLLVFKGGRTWYNANHYNKAFNENFIASCRDNGGKQAYCACFLSEVQHQYSYRQAVQLDARASRGDVDLGVMKLSENCS